MSVEIIEVPKKNALDPETRQTITETKEDTTNIQDQLLILMGAVADLYEVVIGGDEV